MKFPQDLFNAASVVRDHAYAPYSGYRVSSAIRAESGEIFVGVNVENISYGGAICAERTAASSLVTAGKRMIVEVLVITEDGGTPCGFCRQFLHELSRPATLVWCCDPRGNHRSFTMAELLPHAWHSDVVNRKE